MFALDLARLAASLRYRWVREGGWKLIAPVAGLPELYHVEEDPEEETNVAAQRTDLVRRLLERLDAWWRPDAP